MTAEEFARIAVAIKAYYPKEKIMPDDHAQELWYQALKDIPYKTIYLAVMQWKDTEPWSPTIADLRRICYEINNGETASWDESWEKVLQAVRYFGYNRQLEALNSFDELTRTAVGRVGWKQICMSEEIAMERANFRNIYNALVERQRKEGQIAPAVRRVVLSSQTQKPPLEGRMMDLPQKEEKAKNDSGITDRINKMLQRTKDELKEGAQWG